MSIVVGRNNKEFGIEGADNEFLMSTNKDFGYPRHLDTRRVEWSRALNIYGRRFLFNREGQRF